MSVVLTAEEHASDGCRCCTEPDEGTGFGVFDAVQAIQVADILDHFDVTLLNAQVLAVVVLDGSHADVGIVRVKLKVNGDQRILGVESKVSVDCVGGGTL